MQEEHSVSIPGATEIRLIFDPECCSEANYDRLTFTWSSQPGHVAQEQRSGPPPWADMVIEADSFTYTWQSDGSNNAWGYRFMISHNGARADSSGSPGGGSAPQPPGALEAQLADGLWLLEFLLDQLPEPGQPLPAGAGAAQLLRPEFPALLLAHAERDLSGRLVALLQRYVEACTAHKVELDWTRAAQALQVMAGAAQERRDQSALQQLVGLRLALPQVPLTVQMPRLQLCSSGAELSLQEQVCVATTVSGNGAWCKVITSSKVLCFSRLTDAAEVWVGVALIPTGEAAEPSCEDAYLFRVADAARLERGNMVFDPSVQLSESLRKVTVTLDPRSRVVFEATGLRSVVSLPRAPEGSTWRFVTRLAQMGSSVQVEAPSGLSNGAIKKLTAATDGLKAALNYEGVTCPDNIMADAFLNWWDARLAAAALDGSEGEEGQPASSEPLLALLLPRLSTEAVPVEVPAPCGRSTLRVGVPGATRLLLRFSPETLLPERSVAIVTQDAEGRKPLRLTWEGSEDGGNAGAEPQAVADARRGVVAAPAGQRYEIQAEECFVHFPAKRPAWWESMVDNAGASTSSLSQVPDSIVEESEHPYPSNCAIAKQVSLPGAERLRVTFHPECCTEPNYDILRFFCDEAHTQQIGDALSGSGQNWQPFEVAGSEFWYTFTSDGSNNGWGFHFTVSPISSTSAALGNAGGQSSEAQPLFDGGARIGEDGALLFLGNDEAEIYQVFGARGILQELRPGVFAGEVAVDFTNQGPEAGGIAVGLATHSGQTLTWQVSDSAPGLSAWWRSDGSILPTGTAALAMADQGPDSDRAFGAGDVVGVKACVESGVLQRLELYRSGSKVFEVELSSGAAALDTQHLVLCVALRQHAACLSLLPSPQLLVHKPTTQEAAQEEVTLEEAEMVRVAAVFSGLDASGDGTLSREEIAGALGGVRSELFESLDTNGDGSIGLDEWERYCQHVKLSLGSDGLTLFLHAFRRKLAHLGRVVQFPEDEDLDSSQWTLKVSAQPVQLTQEGLVRAAKEVVPEEWAQFEALAFTSWSPESYNELMQLVGRWSAKCAGARPTASELLQDNSEHRNLHVPSRQLVARYALISALNNAVRDDVLPLCDLSAPRATAFGRVLSEARHLLLPSLKFDRFNEIVRTTMTSDEMGICMDRQLAVRCRQAGECDTAGEQMLFAQASIKAEFFPVGVFRSNGASYGRPLQISYEHEAGVDQGGLYRDFLDACASELMSAQLPILVPTANNRDNVGEYREAWTLSPTPITKSTRRMLHFLGKLMGICVRRGDVMPLSLSRIVWKLLVGDGPTLEDLEQQDVSTAESLRMLQNVASLGIGPEDFEGTFGDLRFVVRNSLGVEVPLEEGGEKRKVTFETAGLYARLATEALLQEAAAQVACIREGMALAVPVHCFALWSWSDLEMRVCGNPGIDVAVLRQHAIYESTSESEPEVQFMWEALSDFQQKDLQRLLRFCWGRSRLPSEGSPLWGNGFKVARASDLNPQCLPRGHTCFFQLDLPPYTSAELAREKILFAVRNCDSMLMA